MLKFLGKKYTISKNKNLREELLAVVGWSFGSKDFYTEEEPEFVLSEKKDVSGKFKVGDKVTYKSKDECGGVYENGGIDKGGYVGTILEYSGYDLKNGCYKIKVTTDHGHYYMLESEFKEWDSPSLGTFGITGTSQVSGMHFGIPQELYGGIVSHKIPSYSPPPGSIVSGSSNNPYIPGIHRSPEENFKSVDEVEKYYQKPNLLNNKKRKKQHIVLNQKTI
jgi:hypothetical protein